jgi:DNA replicative helicase MCM subunit Mcm2 (Cdc46/Mcm family)
MPLKYYQEVAQKMSQNEDKTMYVNFSHLSHFQHEDPQFIENIVQYYYKYEPDMNRALTRLMGQYIEQQRLQKSYFQIAIFNLP